MNQSVMNKIMKKLSSSVKIEPIINEIWYAWIAPDGAIQTGIMAPDLPMCIGITQVTQGAQSPGELLEKGFTIQRVCVNISKQKVIEKVNG